jgi:hypothetical protein
MSICSSCSKLTVFSKNISEWDVSGSPLSDVPNGLLASSAENISEWASRGASMEAVQSGIAARQTLSGDVGIYFEFMFRDTCAVKLFAGISCEVRGNEKVGLRWMTILKPGGGV